MVSSISQVIYLQLVIGNIVAAFMPSVWPIGGSGTTISKLFPDSSLDQRSPLSSVAAFVLPHHRLRILGTGETVDVLDGSTGVKTIIKPYPKGAIEDIMRCPLNIPVYVRLPGWCYVLHSCFIGLLLCLCLIAKGHVFWIIRIRCVSVDTYKLAIR